MTSTKLRCFNGLFLVIDHRRQYKQQHDAYEVSTFCSLSPQPGIRLCFLEVSNPTLGMSRLLGQSIHEGVFG